MTVVASIPDSHTPDLLLSPTKALEYLSKLFEDSDLELGKQTKKVIKYLDRVLKEGSDQREMIQDIKVKDTTTTGLYINRIDEALGRLIKRARDMILAVRSKPLVVG